MTTKAQLYLNELGDQREIAALREALNRLLERYTGLVNSGDAGFWDPETEQEVIDARAALRTA